MQTETPSLSIDEPAEDAEIRIQQLRTITAAYKNMTPAEPLLPSADSQLPALLALRSTLNLVDHTKASIRETKAQIKQAQVDLGREEADLRDARQKASALEARIEKLHLERDAQSRKSHKEIAAGILLDQQQQRSRYERELKKLAVAFNKFVDEHLAVMVAAEELGGPVVGDANDINEETLRVGFNQQGRAKNASNNTKGEARRKWRNDQIWGSGDEDEDQVHGARGEKDAAGADFRALMEDLLNAAAGDETSNPFVTIPRESAAVRFLVRAKVAHFHPKDARRLRLIDFGRELDDED